MGGSGRDEAVLDLSAWPQQPAPTAPPARSGLPPRPVRRRRPLSVPAGPLAAGLGAVAVVLLAVPLPGTGCPSALSVWAADPKPLPTATPSGFDDATVTADATAVAAATTALSRHDAAVAAAKKVLAAAAPAPSVRRTVTSTSGDVTALERAVRTDTAARDQAKAALDRLVEQQQAADDPSAYDADVAAAQEDLDVAEARLADDQRALAQARRATTATTTAPAQAPAADPGRTAAQALVAGAPAARAGLVEQLATAKEQQAQHLAQRRTALASWASEHAHDVAAVTAANARLAGCQGAARTSGGAGALLALASAGVLLRRRLG